MLIVSFVIIVSSAWRRMLRAYTHLSVLFILFLSDNGSEPEPNSISNLEAAELECIIVMLNYVSLS